MPRRRKMRPRKLGFGSFSDFVKSRAGVVELDEAGNRIRIRPKKG